ncbi:DUF2076 family protein [Aliihoeflea aestuarii]|jgi:uncharacterized protein|uniref:DUF2076 domain-containing protein n=1 Tax=Aliihoeflea aestuarii TaxID=453840 RepID=UPI00209488B7|nr:DUF2076 domain-containing protein [Aliihoeflea aestuarii]MCO6392850.1 DUF2076 family protein [Aliihoeflea aestuarii]
MDRNDKQAIEDLFGKLAEVERQSQPRDGESEAFIREQIARQPGAPYYMAQTIVVQEQALKAAQARIEELEAGASQGSGGLLGGLFGGGSQNARGSVPRTGRSPMGAPNLSAQSAAPGRSGGGFLAGAAQTAMGVAGGVLLANMLGGMIAGDAQAGEPGIDEVDAGADDAGFDGGDFGDFDI